NRVLIQDILPGIKQLPTDEQFREYFIEGVDFSVEDLNWPGKYADDGGDTPIYILLLVEDEFVSVDVSADEDYRFLFNQVTNYTGAMPADIPTFAQGADLEFVMEYAQAAQEQYEPALFLPLSAAAKAANPDGIPSELYTELSFSALYGMITSVALQGTKLKTWHDLTDTEQARAKMDYLGYERLFDMQFLSEFKKTVTTLVPVQMATQSIYDMFHDQSLYDVIAMGGSTSTSASIQFVLDALDDDGADKAGGAAAQQFASEAAPEMQGVFYEDDTDGIMFVAGVYVEGRFQATPVGTLGFGDFEVHSYTVYKKYFDFWFNEFVPFDPAIHYEPYDTPGEGDKYFASLEEAALAHWLPPYQKLVQAMADNMDGIPDKFKVDGHLVFSQEAAADYAEIIRSGFTQPGTVMTIAEAQAIHDTIEDAVNDIAEQFFIAGIDYNEDYSNPAKEGAGYEASFFAREDKILSGDKQGDSWEKLYSPTEGLGRINRNLEGIPTATFWELDFTGESRDVVPYQLDDGSDVFLRVPEHWWANYEMTTLGNNRTDPDDKKLQYVGNVDTYDELVGQFRQVAQLEYTQEWSYMEYQEYPPADPEAG
ncbi:MAG: hypothetical protein KAJ19_23080, partial [Gammaproteobacteria bacterium]|nr:hypothetical protein [Gammaproteobacteria bacterium]